MASRRADTKKRAKLSRAEIKAYEARRAEERRRLALHAEDEDIQGRADSTAYSIARDDEFEVIKSDLVRLGWIVGVLVLLLVGATIVLA